MLTGDSLNAHVAFPHGAQSFKARSSGLGLVSGVVTLRGGVDPEGKYGAPEDVIEAEAVTVTVLGVVTLTGFTGLILHSSCPVALAEGARVT